MFYVVKAWLKADHFFAQPRSQKFLSKLLHIMYISHSPKFAAGLFYYNNDF